MLRKMKCFLLLFIAICFQVFSVKAQDVRSYELTTKQDSVSYAIGMDIANNLTTQHIDVVVEALSRGIIDFLESNDLLLSESEKAVIINEFQRAHAEKMQEIASEQEAKHFREGTQFLEENKNKEGVKVTESGLQYKIIEKGEGKRPSASSTVLVHYEGRLIDGTVFDSSYQRGEPISFPLTGVIAGWTEGLQLIKEGGKAELYIPHQLAYGEQGAGNVIPGYATLIFTVELIEIKDAE